MRSRRLQQDILRQLRHRISTELAAGVLEHGDRLPSARELAAELRADPRVVLAAYEQLAEEDLVEIRPRSGVFVTGAQAPSRELSPFPRRWAVDLLVGAVERDIPFDRLGEHIQSDLGTKRLRAAVVECNTDQLRSMQSELTTYFGLEVATIELDRLAGTATPPRELVDADLVISAGHDDLIAGIAAKLRKPHVITKVRRALLARLARLLARGPVYFLVVDPRFGAKMRRLVAAMPGSENFHVLMAGGDDLRVIPPGAPTYVMRSALPLLAHQPLRGRVITPIRIFAEETARELFSRILDATPDRAQRREPMVEQAGASSSAP